MSFNSFKHENYPSSVMRIDFNAMKHNLNQFRQRLKPTTRILLVLKAHAYGTNVKQTTQWVQQTGLIDYIAVAFIDEAVEMRQVGIDLPIMIMTIDQNSFEICQKFHVEPVIHSLSILQKLIQWINQSMIENKSFRFPDIHIKVNTGMNRLGIEIDDLPQLIDILSNSKYHLNVKSIYSHLSASDDPKEDNYTNEQGRIFLSATQFLEKTLGYSTIKHLCNTFGILRHPHLHLDMVRLGAGIFGGGCFPSTFHLLPAISLTTTIAQVYRVKQGTTIGYNRRGLATRDSRLAVIRIGYADGLRRHMGNGKTFVWLRNYRVPIIKGSVCMDMTTIDLTDLPSQNDADLENNIVEIFGEHIDINEVAQWCDTIAYELITSINQRVKRIYIDQSNQFDENSTNNNSQNKDILQ